MSTTFTTRRRTRRLAGAFTVVAVAAFVTGCSGKTTGARQLAFNETPTKPPIGQRFVELSAEGSCDQQCYYRFVVNPGSKLGFTTRTVGPIGRIAGTRFTERVSLPPGFHTYQVCGKGDGLTDFVCVGPDGTPNTKHKISVK